MHTSETWFHAVHFTKLFTSCCWLLVTNAAIELTQFVQLSNPIFITVIPINTTLER